MIVELYLYFQGVSLFVNVRPLMLPEISSFGVWGGGDQETYIQTYVYAIRVF
jgi:hypothetical protein